LRAKVVDSVVDAKRKPDAGIDGSEQAASSWRAIAACSLARNAKNSGCVAA
jgi:hypothetical protein